MTNGSREFTLSVDSFNDPKVYKSPKSIQALLTRIILLNPGEIQSHPDMGVGIFTRFRFSIDDGNLVSNLCSEIRNQIDTYLPMFVGAQVTAELKQKTLYGSITINNYIFQFAYDTDKNTFNTVIRSISDL